MMLGTMMVAPVDEVLNLDDYG